jgi:hypothetical protein
VPNLRSTYDTKTGRRLRQQSSGTHINLECAKNGNALLSVTLLMSGRCSSTLFTSCLWISWGILHVVQ